MFRPMRRAGQALPEAECLRILREGTTGVLALTGDDGWPYAVPVNYAWADDAVWFHCAKTGHKLDAIRRCEKVSFCVIEENTLVPEKLTTYYRSVILFGRARILESEDELLRAAQRFGERYLPDPAAVAQEAQREKHALCCVQIVPEHLTGKEARELSIRRKQQDA